MPRYYDNSQKYFYIFNKKGKKLHINKYQAGRTGETCPKFVNKIINCNEINKNNFTTVQKQLEQGILPELTYYKNPFDKCLSKNKNSDTISDQCLQRRRSYRNYQNSLNEIKKCKIRKNNKKKQKCNSYNNNLGIKYKYIGLKGKYKNFKKFCFINGNWNCVGNLLIPKNTTLPNYLDTKNNYVKKCELDYYNQAQPIYYNYKYINGHWVYLDQSIKCNS